MEIREEAIRALGKVANAGGVGPVWRVLFKWESFGHIHTPPQVPLDPTHNKAFLRDYYLCIYMYIDVHYTNYIIDLIAKYVALCNYGKYSTQQFKFCSDKNQPVPSVVPAFELLHDFILKTLRLVYNFMDHYLQVL